MSTEQTSPEVDSHQLAKDAINYVLSRIAKDENIRYHMGAFTEAFERLKAAHCALTGISPEAVEAEVFGCELKRLPAAKKIDEIRDLVQEYNNNSDDKGELISKILAVID